MKFVRQKYLRIPGTSLYWVVSDASGCCAELAEGHLWLAEGHLWLIKGDLKLAILYTKGHNTDNILTAASHYSINAGEF